jgi:integrase
MRQAACANSIHHRAVGQAITLSIGAISPMRVDVVGPIPRSPAGNQEEARLLKAAGEARSPVLATFVKALLLTGMRCGELTGMRWEQVNLEQRVITVGEAKTNAGTGRQIPMNQELVDMMKDHATWFTKRFGETRPEHYLFPAGERSPNDPTRPTSSFKTAWGNLRDDANVRCRLHDLRHTAITNLAESGASDSTIMALAGHLSRAMLERYSHIRMNAKRLAMECMTLKPKANVRPDSQAAHKPGNPERLNRTNDGKCENSVPN